MCIGTKEIDSNSMRGKIAGPYAFIYYYHDTFCCCCCCCPSLQSKKSGTTRVWLVHPPIGTLLSQPPELWRKEDLPTATATRLFVFLNKRPTKAREIPYQRVCVCLPAYNRAFSDCNICSKMTKLRIATLQLNSIFANPLENITKIERIISQAQSSPNYKPIDLLVLPEMVMTGYNFKSSEHVRPLLESPEKPGVILNWGKDISKRLGCFTVLGYAQAAAAAAAAAESASPTSPTPTPAKKDLIYNSAIVFNKQGEIIHNYNKSFLYETDEVFGCTEGPGFKSFQLTNQIKASIGICMDLNPYQFKAPFDAFEFSKHCMQEQVDLIIAPMAWLHNKSPSIIENLSSPERERLEGIYQAQFQSLRDDDVDADDMVINDQPGVLNYDSDEISKEFKDLHEPDFNNLDYWILRFLPYVNHFRKPLISTKPTTMIISNRSGLEDDILFGGTSSILKFNGKHAVGQVEGYDSIDCDNNSVDVLGTLGKGDEGILIRDVEV